ncbi:MAG TPA: Smr/MutS family protein [Steroidobacteraceae bacterium]|nr:Smr/MutS family protein [Steroidobacteraceae bacterium]
MSAEHPTVDGGDADADADADAAEQEAAAFRAAMRGVRPLPQAAAAPAAAIERARKQKPRSRRPPSGRSDGDADGDATASSAAAPPALPAAPEEYLSFRRSGVRDRQLRRLRRGLYPIEGELDLHGLTLAHAERAFAAFIDASRGGGRRCVRIIHGKGMRSGARGAVLKSAVNGWLRHRSEILAFTSARQLDGGTGAVYVLLRA